MKTLKPQTLSILTRVFELTDRYMLAMTGIVCLDFNNPKKLAHEAQLWMAAQDHLGDGAMDEAMPKPRGEVLVLGSACAKKGTTTTTAGVRIELKRGERSLIHKGLMVFGDRTWTRFGMTQPEPFEKMPVTWERAFGGPDYEANAIGRGLVPMDENGVKVHRLPNVEDLVSPIQGPGDRPTPVGFGPLQIVRKERMSRAGTYDKSWLDKVYPAPPDDFHWEFYNVAPLDQRISGFFEGNETLRVDGMHPEERILETTLPGLVVKFFLQRKGKEGEALEVRTARIDSLIALPTAGKLAVVYRAVAPVESDDAHDVATIMGAVEAGDAPKTIAHYQAALETRLDKEKALYALLNDHELLPDWNIDTKATLDEVFGETGKILTPEGHAFAFHERGMEKTIETMRASLVERGMDTTAFEERIAKLREDRKQSKTPGKLEDLGSFLQAVDARAKKAIGEAEVEIQAMKAKAKLELEKVGVTDDPLVKGGHRKTGPPECFVASQYARMNEVRTMMINAGIKTDGIDAQIADRELKKRLEDAEKQILGLYRKSAQIMPPIEGVVTPEVARERGLKLLELAKANQTLDNVDLTFADLSDLDFSNLCIDGALIEYAKVIGTKFRNTKMKEVVLTHAEVRDSVFDGADLESANLGFAKITSSTFIAANLNAAVLADVEVEGGSFTRAVLGGMHTKRMKMKGVDLSEIRAPRAMFVESVFNEVKLDGSDLTDATVTQCQFDDCSFEACILKRTVLFETRGEKVSFERADLRDTRFVECSFPGSRFAGAQLKLTLLRGCNLAGANMEDISAEDCDFSEADMTKANLTRMSARRSLFIRTILDHAVAKKIDLMSACVQKAFIRSTDFRGANCFRADFSRAVGDDKTDFSGAYVKETRTARDPKSKKSLFST